ncbi:uncharacterized protein [Aegilops tauschii subsp. strangulata]|uniref:uncharacterized protein n=1 Tax=Aegilops tauschii subsp. strangulata TaxID=200361 RepID=UPI003CC86316
MEGRISTLRRFVSRLSEKAIPLYQMLKKTDHFVWSDAANKAFEDLKKQLAEPPILAPPLTKSLCSCTLHKEVGKEYPVQRPVYYISEVSTESKQRYPHWQKLVFGVFMASRKLKNYFLEHPITVVSSAPLGDIIQNREATCLVAK